MSRVKVLFVCPYFRNRADICSPVFAHNAAFQLKAYLESVPALAAAFEFKILDLEGMPFFNRGLTDEDDLNLFDVILREQPQILAFSLYCWNSPPLHALARALKQMAPEIISIAGGPEVYDRRDFCKQFPAFDVLVEGDGELPLRAVLEKYPDEPSDVANVSFRRQGRWIHNRAGRRTCDINDIPNYYREQRKSISDYGLYLTTRGCPNGCDYCLWARQPMRRKSQQKQIEELDTLINHTDLKQLTLFDFDLLDIYRNDRQFFDTLAGLVGRRGGGFSINFFTNPASLTDPDLGKLVERLAVKRIFAGLQTGNLQAAQAVNRGWAIKPLEHFAKVEEAMRSRILIELMYPLPRETPASFLETLNYLIGLGYFRFRVFQLMVLRGTRLRRRADELGLRYLDSPPYFCYETPTSSRQDTLRMGRLGYIITLLGNVLDGFREADTARGNLAFDRRLLDRILAGIDDNLHPDEIMRREIRRLCGIDYPASFVLGDYKGPLRQTPSIYQLPGGEKVT